MSQALAVPTAVYAQVEPIPHRDRRRAGQPTPDGWADRFIAYLTEHGKGWKAAKQAGVSYDTVQRLRALDKQFAQDEQDAMREFTESLESNLDRIAAGDDMPAVTANIVRLKKLDPVGYVERNLQITASFTTELPAADGKALLHAMLGQPNLLPAETGTRVKSLETGETVTAGTDALSVVHDPPAPQLTREPGDE